MFKRISSIRWGARSGTMVFRPTPAARRFVEIWRDLSDTAPVYSIDQDSLAVAMGKSPCTLDILDGRYCAVPKDNLQDPWIFHYSALRIRQRPSGCVAIRPG